MATPVTAGAVALVIEEYRNTHGGLTPAPDLVKAILASSATDLSYDQFTQGSGRVNVWDAVAAASEGHDNRLPTRFYLYSPATWDSVKKLLSKSWAVNLQTPIPTTSSVSANWYAGIVQPGASESATFDIQNAEQPSAQAYTYTLVSTTTSRYTANSTVTWVQIPKSTIPTNADLMKVTLVYHFSDFVNATSWNYNNLLLAQIYDTNFDSAGHISRLTNGAPYSTTSELIVGRPLTKFLGTPAVRIVKQGPAKKIGFELVFRYYTNPLGAGLLNFQLHIILSSNTNRTKAPPRRLRWADRGHPTTEPKPLSRFPLSYQSSSQERMDYPLLRENSLHQLRSLRSFRLVLAIRGWGLAYLRRHRSARRQQHQH